MNLVFEAGRITGNLVVLPETEQRFEDDMVNFDFPRERSLKLKEVMGYDRHRIAGERTCVSDLAGFGLRTLAERGLLDVASLDALIVVTQTPDYWIPPTSCVLHGALGLREDALCLDITQGCAGFIVGLMEALQWLRQPHIRKVALVTADVLSRRISPKDRNSYPLTGDAAAITLVERAEPGVQVHGCLKFDGKRSAALQIPAGGCRLPSSPETALLQDCGDHNLRALDHLRMDGTAVFNFVMNDVPPMIEALLAAAGRTRDDIDYFLFHQPNRFMLRKLAERLQVPYERVPDWVTGTWGNSNSVTIPAALAGTLGAGAQTNRYTVCFAGFGVGLTWGGLVMPLERLAFNDVVDYREP
ncbi:MAG TPA: ketoacyl-ACP synthase III [Burkholderiales bacterium]|nr:ketoacyl-ACP synthase III [Burkholderiales bacterium]